jgi:hypothetical protein
MARGWLMVLGVASSSLLACSRTPALVTAPARSCEARLAYAGADRHRPYDPPRGAASAEAVSLQALAALERRNDTAGVVAGHLLLGNRALAASLLEKAPRTVALDVARAVVALEAKRPEDALELLDGVLDRQPAQPQALWDRGLALRDLGLELAAAEAFERVAALGEPGWSDEARARAAALRPARAGRQKAWGRIESAGDQLLRHGVLPPASLVAERPDFFRRDFYVAAASAPSRERLQSLRPLALELDRRDGGHALEALLDRQLRGDMRARPARVANFLTVYAWPRPELDRFLGELGRAGERDLAIATLMRSCQQDTHLEQFVALIRELADPWLSTWAERALAHKEIARRELLAAERRLVRAIEVADRHHFDHRALVLRSDLTDVYRLLHRTAEAQAVGRAALLARDQAPPGIDDTVMFLLADVARLRNAFSLMAAYLREGVLRSPGNCEVARFEHSFLVQARLARLDVSGAAREAANAPRCPSPIDLPHADVLASLARAGQPLDPHFAADVAALRPQLTPAGRAFADIVEGRALIDRDPPAGAALVERGIAAARAIGDANTDALKAHTYGARTLAVDRARRGDYGGALVELADAVHRPLPASGCVLGVGVDEGRSLAVVRDARGQLSGWYVQQRRTAELEPDALVGKEAVRALDGCAEVAVIAPPPVHGLPAILPPEIAWSYGSARAATVASSPSPSRRRLVVSDVDAPAALGLPRLAPWRTLGGGDRVWLHGADATPARVLEELADASEVEIHAHGLVDASQSDASLIVLSPGVDGDYALSGGRLRQSRLAARPVVILAACHAAQVAPFSHEPWGLPLALIDAGARAVIASTAPIPDAEAAPFFEAVLSRVRAGTPPAIALRDERQASLRDPRMAWTREVMLFE